MVKLTSFSAVAVWSMPFFVTVVVTLASAGGTIRRWYVPAAADVISLRSCSWMVVCVPFGSVSVYSPRTSMGLCCTIVTVPAARAGEARKNEQAARALTRVLRVGYCIALGEKEDPLSRVCGAKGEY